jgi:putative membrane protein
LKVFGFILFLVIVILGVTFAILNSSLVTVHYYVGIKQLPLSLLLVIAFVVGLIVSFLIVFIKIVRLRTELRRLKKQLRVAEKEIKNLRAIPIKDEH